MTTSPGTPPPTRPELLEKLRSEVRDGLPAAIADLSGLVRIPSVSWPAFDEQHVHASAEAVAQLARDLGVFDTVQVLQAAMGDSDQLGKPAVLATRAAKAGKPTVVLYAHHDVQPPGNEEDWDTPPYAPTVRGDRLYGRGAADDKAGVMAHIAAIRALIQAQGDDLDLGITLFVEGEEEYGSPSFGRFLSDHEDQLRGDVIVVADSDNWDTSTPSLTVALRGAVGFEVEISTLAHASHSGMFGGAAPDAMLAAIQLLATLHDEHGSVAVDGLTSADLPTPDYPESQLRQDAALLDGVRPIGVGPILSRLWAQPAITVTGIDAPSLANASNTLTPTVRVRISVRVAPAQDAASALAAIESHLHRHAPFGAQLRIGNAETGEPFLVDTSGWAVAESAVAMEEAWGKPAMRTGVGGSIPFIADLAARFPDAQILVTGVEDPDTRAHSPNESLHLGVFRRAILTEAILLARLNER